MSGGYLRFTLGSILKWAVLLLITGLLLWYGIFQARLLIAGPSLALDARTAVSHSTRVVTVQGTAHNVTAVTLNDRSIFTDDQGSFHEQLVLENGYTIMTIRAKDRYGRMAVLTHPFVYVPAYASSAIPAH